jgi:hypothetical protein
VAPLNIAGRTLGEEESAVTLSTRRAPSQDAMTALRHEVSGMQFSRRQFLIGASVGLVGCQSAVTPTLPIKVPAEDPPVAPPTPPVSEQPPPAVTEPPATPSPPAVAEQPPDPVPPPEPPPPPPEPVGNPAIVALQTFLRERASPTASLPTQAADVPKISWAGPFATSADTPPTSLPNGQLIPITDPLISRAIPQYWGNSLPGRPMLLGMPCLRALRTFTCRGMAREVGSTHVLRLKTDAPVLEMTGVVGDAASTLQTLIVDGALVPAQALSSDRGYGGGWNGGTLRFDFGSRRLRDIWIETAMNPAFIKVDQASYLFPVGDANDLQMSVIGDSYLQVRSDVFGNGAAIALGMAARLGIRKVATDAVGGTGYWNTGGEYGNLSDRMAADAADNSDIYVVIAGINDYVDTVSGVLRWPSQDEYESGILNYFRGLRTARPNALIVATSPFCPIPSYSDAFYVASTATNPTGLGDNLYKASVVKKAIGQISPPWVYIDVLMGTGWLNSSGATGDITNLQWLTGGTPAANTSATYKPGNNRGGGGGGFGGIDSIPILRPGRYTQAPEIRATGGSGHGLLLSSRIDRTTGALTTVVPVVPGAGYTADALPTLVIDRTFEIAPATIGTPTLLVGINPNGQYPLLSFAPPGVSAADLNNIYVMLAIDTVHPSLLGAEYIAKRLAKNIYDAVAAL